MKNSVKYLVAFLVCVLVGVTAACCVTYACETPAPVFDTSVLQTWCRGMDQGPIRMVGAWQAEGYDKGVVEDEQGNLWNITEDYEEYDFLLLWIADNHTEDVTDDEIMKVWREAYTE